MSRETPEEWYARLTTRDGILRELLSKDGGLPDSPARAKLKREKLIESYRHHMLTKHKGARWRLTDAGRAVAVAL
jgi:hypothetical protein